MTTYACVQSGWVVEIFTPLPSWESIPVAQLFAPGFFDSYVPIDGVNPKPESGWKYAGGQFTAPTEADNAAMRAALIARPVPPAPGR